MTLSPSRTWAPGRASRRIRTGALTVGLFVVVLIETVVIARHWTQEHAEDWHFLHVDSSAPYAGAVRTLLKSLRYTSLPALMRPSVELSYDTNTQTWMLLHYYQVGPGGAKQLLESDRYGLCGNLALYTYHRLVGIVDPARYSLKLVRGAYAGYFGVPTGSHIIVLLIDEHAPTEPDRLYLIDPSFGAYDKAVNLDEYAFYEELDADALLDNPDAHIMFDFGDMVPIFTRRSHLVSLTVRRDPDAADPAHVIVELTATRRYAYISTPLLKITRARTMMTITENAKRAGEIMDQKPYRLLRNRLIMLTKSAKLADHIVLSPQPTLPLSIKGAVERTIPY